MGERTAIEWTDATWNCWQGCHKVSPGCKNCYMFRDKQRYGQDPNTVVRSAESTFNLPLTWARNPEKYGHIKRVFVDSWSDFFIAEADPWRDEAWEIMRATPQFTYQILTKRPERIAQCLPADWGSGYPNVGLGTTTENQPMLDLRTPILLKIPAAFRFLSCEPLLGLITFEGRWVEYPNPAMHFNWLDEIDWLICGGESGPSARPMDPYWARSLRDQCEACGVPFFFKQWGEWIPTLGQRHGLKIYEHCQTGDGEDLARVGKKAAGALLDGREWKEFPR